LQFTKYHGLGNDFIVVDTSSPTAWTANQARSFCDRHRGIGADGVLLVGPARDGVRASMRVLNADGSEPEMCGNGLRCVALHLAYQDELTHAVFEVSTGAGVLGCTVDRKGSDANVRIAMGKAKVLAEPLTFDAGGRRLSFDRVSTGNPHAIVFDEPFDLAAIDQWAPLVSASIPGGSNIEFVERLGPNRLNVVVWERGVGRTEACGTGAVASAVAAAVRGWAPFAEPVRVDLPGGPLSIEVSESLNTWLEGPAQRVFQGEVRL